MSEEKIVAEEVLDEAEMEGVVGGYYDTWGDYKNFMNLGGGYYQYRRYLKNEVMTAFKNVGRDLGLNIKADLVYDDKPGESPNRYYINDEQVSRDEMWALINEAVAANKK